MNKRMRKILCYAFRCGMRKLERKTGTFELMGIDFMIDDKFKLYLIEMNTNPAITLGKNNKIKIYLIKN
jgi:hypothetical protein